jgi:hypothetical protein
MIVLRRKGLCIPPPSPTSPLEPNSQLCGVAVFGIQRHLAQRKEKFEAQSMEYEARSTKQALGRAGQSRAEQSRGISALGIFRGENHEGAEKGKGKGKGKGKPEEENPGEEVPRIGTGVRPADTLRTTVFRTTKRKRKHVPRRARVRL